MVPYPVDKLLPLSVKVSIGEHMSMNMRVCVCVCTKILSRVQGGAERDNKPDSVSVNVVKKQHSYQILPPLFSVACQVACFGVAKQGSSYINKGFICRGRPADVGETFELLCKKGMKDVE